MPPDFEKSTPEMSRVVTKDLTFLVMFGPLNNH